MKLHIYTEWETLNCVAVASPINFVITEPINATQRRIYPTGQFPLREVLEQEHAALLSIFMNRGIKMVNPKLDPMCPYQFNVRDAIVVIHDFLVEARMARPIRIREPTLLLDAIQMEIPSPIRRLTQGTLEGGDVVIDGNRVFIGVSERTDVLGLRGLTQAVQDSCVVVPLPLNKNVLHLDTALSFPSSDTAIVFPDAFAGGLPPQLAQFDLILLDEQEFMEQAANVLPLSPTEALVDQRQERLMGELRRRNISVLPVKIDHITRIGGGLRCMTQALVRN